MKSILQALFTVGLALVAHADEFVKADNVANLNDPASWTNSAVPGAADTAVWDSAVTGANSVALGGPANWSGLRVLNPGGSVTILSNTTAAALTLGAGGIDLSAATVNLTIHPSMVITDTQTWSIAGGRTLTLLSVNNTGTGTGDLLLTRSGTGVATVVAAQNGNGATWRNFAGNWVMGTGVTVVAQGQHGDALGRGMVTFQGGRLAQNNGNWNFNNRMFIGPGGGTIESQSSVGGRYMPLSGVLAGSDPLFFNTPLAGSLGEGFILVASNEFSGPITIGTSAVVKIGGNATTNLLSSGNGTNGSIDQVTAITNYGTIRVGRTDGYNFRPDLRITGPGTLRVNTGCTATLHGTGTLATATLLSLGGPLILAGEQTVAGLFSANTETNGDVQGCGTLTIAVGSTSGYFYYGNLSGVTNLRLRVGAQTIAQPNGNSSGTGNFFILQRPPPAGLVLDTGSSAASRKDLGWINDIDQPLQLSALTGYGAIRSDAGGVAGHPRLILVDQAVDTTFNGGLVAGGLNRNVIFSKSGAGSLTLAGFIGHQTGQSGVVDLHVSNGTLNVSNDNATPANGTTGIWTVAQGGVLAFSSGGLGRGGAGTLLLNGGTLRWNTGNAQDISPRVVLGDGSSITLDSGSNVVLLAADLATGPTGDARVIKTGAGRLIFAASNHYAGPTVIEAGALALSGMGDLASASITIRTGATLDVAARPEGSLVVRTGQTVKGDGSVEGSLLNEGVIAPGESIGTLFFTGGLTQMAGAVRFDLGGAAQCDQLVAAGAIRLDGTLAVALTNGYVPAVGDSFTLMVASSIAGTFAASNLPALGTNSWQVDVTPAAVTLSVVSGGIPPAGYDLFAAQVTNPSARGYADDPDGDGYANLLEYATGASPTNADTVARLLGARAGGALQAVFGRDTNAADITVVVEGADRVAGPWQGVLTNSNGAWSGPAAYAETGATSPVQVTVTDVTNAPSRHLRLRISRP